MSPSTPRATHPPSPGGLPLLGHVWPLVRDPLRFLTTLPSYGPMVTLRLGPMTTVLLCDPELTRQFLLDDKTFDKAGPFFERLEDFIMGNGLGACPHREHRGLRRVHQPAFNTDQVQAYIPGFVEAAELAVNGWRDGQVLDVYNEMYLLSLRSGLRTLASTTLPEPALREMLGDILHTLPPLFQVLALPRWVSKLPVPVNQRYRHAQRRLSATATDMITTRRRDGTGQRDLLTALVEAADEGRFTEEKLLEQVLAFLVILAESPAAVLSWMMYLLSIHPEVQTQVGDEAISVLGNEQRPGPEHVARLELTSRVLNESMRLYPPGWLVPRKVTTDTELGGYRLRVGTTVLYSSYLIHHRPDLYPDPERFDPQRWRDRCSHRRGDYIPFAAGARRCIADHFAFTQVVLTAATIARHWRLVATTHDVRPDPRSALIPRNLYLTLRERKGEPRPQ